MGDIKTKEMPFGDSEYDELYLKGRWEHFDRPEFATQRTDLLERALRLSPKDRVLDAGCGIGIYTVELAKRGYDVVGLDISETFLREAKSASRKARVNPDFIEGDYNNLRFKEEFSVLFIIAAFFYTDRRRLMSVLRRMHRALIPGGRLLLDHPNPPLRMRRYPMVAWKDEGDGIFTLTKSEYLPKSQHSSFLWLKLDLSTGAICRYYARSKHLSVAEFKACVREAGFSVQGLYSRRKPELFDASSEDGFFLVARKKGP